MQTNRREALADYAHDSWSRYMRYMFAKCIGDVTGTILIPADYAKHLWRLINLPYAEMSESEKDSDRAEADRILAIMEAINANEPA